MHVALVRQRYSAHGGAERFIERARGALGEQGVAVTVLAREWTGDPGTVVRCDPFHVGRVWRGPGLPRAGWPAIAPPAADLVPNPQPPPGCDTHPAGGRRHAPTRHKPP